MCTPPPFHPTTTRRYYIAMEDLLGFSSVTRSIEYNAGLAGIPVDYDIHLFIHY